jgi:hypothetical protein
MSLAFAVPDHGKIKEVGRINLDLTRNPEVAKTLGEFSTEPRWPRFWAKEDLEWLTRPMNTELGAMKVG